ncbi:unnamed protein product [Cuscuta epithymum]|uniref:Uncharacterized protein n=1 Tax=Cuscuta epithymum TaxID=186058 RepID=A0AAV0FNX5_9ASTE|nr:unnamed protein product [Cuscuta epithymum]
MEHPSSQHISLELSLAPPEPRKIILTRAQEENLEIIEDIIILNTEKEVLDKELHKVLRWRHWRLSSLDILLLTAINMQRAEGFALGWLRTKNIEIAMSMEYISRIYQRRLEEVKHANERRKRKATLGIYPGESSHQGRFQAKKKVHFN